jgi:hypothetical protein
VPFVLTIARRDGAQRVAGALARLAGTVPVLLPFERTADAELSGVLADPAAVVDLVLDLVREGGWDVGVGAGPLPEGLRTGAPAVLGARRAVDAAGQRSVRLAVRGVLPLEAGDAQAVLSVLAVLVQRRSGPAWQAIELVGAGRTQAQAAAVLGISRQAVGQRLTAGLWELERDLRPTAARLLGRAAG